METKTLSTIAHLFTVSLFLSGPTFAQEAHEEPGEEGHHRFAIAGFVGSTRVGSEHEFTVGIEAGIHLNRKWAFGAVVERAERERHSTLVMVGVGWRPTGEGFRLQMGLGRKDPSGKEETVLRAGVGYELELRNLWFLKPYVAVDFIEHENNEEIFGIYFGRGF